MPHTLLKAGKGANAFFRIVTKRNNRIQRQTSTEQFREIKTEAQHVGMNMLPPSVKDHGNKRQQVRWLRTLVTL